jgi:hypothetical protein
MTAAQLFRRPPNGRYGKSALLGGSGIFAGLLERQRLKCSQRGQLRLSAALGSFAANKAKPEQCRG